ncbi:TetR/AcrR family transcriptional regulator [Mycolicibacterium holsaticum]|uniref:TetR/AcrR family transcriptional regulator n=1 Tax=Mycolicibacterium holsaticum TaxID=152142 RepID=UPI001C7D5E6C|nr:TetR/AcrR family transcriptional regulator [Mycolicibacterium holsaticum]MDA4109310.1 hypothetical protein [Mycolicibacterium holsaticum DSM 44478 = JCM 12374]QZA11698.1 TetR/AcrR family transcriptional regulator [Mycolicibacterium holsaticum DSM 44478 = JCM 12374]UNC10815.1 TetR/AcrR family transcriptional regulator [Mycolicibacterium holsaticum DSM 44478 = JCM 12374]
MPKSERRALILDAAREVFLSNGVGAARVADIADAAGVNSALMYQHFSSKEELFSEAVVFPLEQLLARIVQEARELSKGGAADVPERTTEKFIKEVLSLMVELNPLFGIVLFSDPDAGKAFYRDRLEPSLAGLMNWIERALPGWQHNEFDPRQMTLAVFGMCWFIALDSSMRGEQLDVSAAAKQLTTFLFNGVLGPRPSA